MKTLQTRKKKIDLEDEQNPKSRKCGGQNQLVVGTHGKDMCPEPRVRTEPQWSLCWVCLEGRGQGWALQGGGREGEWMMGGGGRSSLPCWGSRAHDP